MSGRENHVASGSRPRVEILLATYNGEAFLREQLESLLAQDHPNLAIAIRDDGSTDSTVEIAEEYAQLPNVTLVRGPNIGVPRAFFALLDAASPESDYVAFADQDDVWMTHKVSRAVAMLSESVPDHEPGLYCARCVITDRRLNPAGHTPVPRLGPSFANSLVQNIATGCTILLNRAAREVLVRKWPKDALVHDWWCYQVVSGLGKVVYDPEPVLYYRQHGGSTMGIGKTPAARLFRKIVRQLKGRQRGVVRRQAQDFRRVFYADLPPEKQQILDAFLEGQASLATRIRYALTGATYRQSIVENLAFKILYVLNRV